MSDTLDRNMKRLKALAADHGLVLNPDGKRVDKVAGLMAKNFDLVGEWVCPCKQTRRPPEKGADQLCPCDEWLEEIERDGHCCCRVFYRASARD